MGIQQTKTFELVVWAAQVAGRVTVFVHCDLCCVDVVLMRKSVYNLLCSHRTLSRSKSLPNQNAIRNGNGCKLESWTTYGHTLIAGNANMLSFDFWLYLGAIGASIALLFLMVWHVSYIIFACVRRCPAPSQL